MRVIDTIRKSAVGVAPDTMLHEVAQLMEQATVASVAVIDGDRLVGIVTDRDLVRRGMAAGLTLHVVEYEDTRSR